MFTIDTGPLLRPESGGPFTGSAGDRMVEETLFDEPNRRSLERRFDPEKEWLDELCRWLQRPPDELGALAWPMILIPEVVDRSLRLAPDTVGVFQRLTWESVVPRQRFDVALETQWVSHLGGSLEVGIRAWALVSGRAVAQSLSVVRMAGTALSWGERSMPCIPSHAARAPFARRRSVVITEAEVRSFNRLAGTKYPANDDRAAAWKLGYPDIIVQGALLLLAQLHIGGMPERGEAQMWFRAPVPAGSVLEVAQCETEDSLWRLQMLGSARVAAVGMLRSS